MRPRPAGDDGLYSDSEPIAVLAGPRRVRPVTEPGDDEPLPEWFDRAHPVEGHEAEVTDDSEAESEASHPRSEEELRKEAKSASHMLLHKPKNKFCPACQQAKAVRMQARRVRQGAKSRAGKYVPTEFADLGTADHFDARKDLSQGACGQCWGLVIKAPGIDWLSGYSQWCKDAMDGDPGVPQPLCRSREA